MRTPIVMSAIVTLTMAVLSAPSAASAQPLQQSQTVTVQSDRTSFVTAVRGSTGKKLRKKKRSAVLRIGRGICRDYEERGYRARTTRSINRSLRKEYDLNKRQARAVSLAARTYLCPKATPDTDAAPLPESETDPTPEPTPEPVPEPTPETRKLELPPNSGWEIKTSRYGGSSYLTTSAEVGKVLPLGNAAALGLDLYGSTCSGEWYESAFLGVEILDATGNAIPGLFGDTRELLGYLAGRSDFSSAGCGGETVELSKWEGASAIRIISNSGSTGTVALFGRYDL